jgi:hypothetical protein
VKAAKILLSQNQINNISFLFMPHEAYLVWQQRLEVMQGLEIGMVICDCFRENFLILGI